MSHVLDDLELFATGALAPDLSSGVAEHLERCVECRAAADEIAQIVALLADAVPPREPPADLRQRILAAARSGPAREPRRSIFDLLRPRVGALVAATAIAVLIGVDTNAMIRLQDSQAQLAAYAEQLERVSRADRSWYMAGVDPWTGMGGTLVVQTDARRPFVLFHDLRPLPEGQMYAVWLIEPDGGWTRGSNFHPDGQKYQLIDVGRELSGFEHCAVTVEASEAGKRQGPVVMQSRIAPPSE